MFDFLKRKVICLLAVILALMTSLCIWLYKDIHKKEEVFLQTLVQATNSCIVSIESVAPVDNTKIFAIAEKTKELHYLLKYGSLFVNSELGYVGHTGDLEYISYLLSLYPENSPENQKNFSSLLDTLNDSLKELQQAAADDINTAGMSTLEQALFNFYDQWSLEKFYCDLPSPYAVVDEFID